MTYDGICFAKIMQCVNVALEGLHAYFYKEPVYKEPTCRRPKYLKNLYY